MHAADESLAQKNDKKPTVAVKPNIYRQTLLNPIQRYDLAGYIQIQVSANAGFNKEFKVRTQIFLLLHLLLNELMLV